MKTKKEIIEETAAYYDADTSRRGRDDKDGTCMYFNAVNNTSCAVGRCAIDPKHLQEVAEDIEQQSIFDSEKRFDSFLKPEYRGHKTNFWVVLQGFHDCDDYWDEKGLTEKGERRKEAIITLYATNTEEHK